MREQTLTIGTGTGIDVTETGIVSGTATATVNAGGNVSAKKKKNANASDLGIVTIGIEIRHVNMICTDVDTMTWMGDEAAIGVTVNRMAIITIWGS